MVDLNNKNYHSIDADREYMSFSQYKGFLECEAKQKAIIDGKYSPQFGIPMLVGSFVHAWNEGADAFENFNYPPNYYKFGSLSQKFYVYGENELHILPVPDSTPSTLSLTIAQTSGTATATSSTAHGLLANDYVLIAGADQSGYNGTFRVLTVPTTLTFTFAVDAGTVSPAAGTITGVWQNLVYRYWRYASTLSASTDTIIIPDQFTDILVAYAYGRYGYLDDTRGNAADGFKEYNMILKDLKIENNKRLWWNKNTAPQSHEYYQE